MGGEDETEACFPALKLPFLHIPAASIDSPEHPSGMATPPLQTSASVPFKWEEQPGRPRPCSDIVPIPEPAKSLELPPCRTRVLFMDPDDKIIKTHSPTTVFDGPYSVGRPKFSSFRFFREGHDSFDSFSSASPDRTTLDLFLGGKKSGGGVKAKGFLGKFSSGGKKDVDGGSCRLSPSSISSCDGDERCRRDKNGGGVKMKRNGSLSSVSHARPSPFWTTISEGIKQAIHWKSTRKSDEEGRD